jgi:hypothetical protein
MSHTFQKNEEIDINNVLNENNVAKRDSLTKLWKPSHGFCQIALDIDRS